MQPAMEGPLPAEGEQAHELEEMKKEHLMLDVRPSRDVNGILLRSMTKTSPWFWVVGAALGAMVVTYFVVWAYQMWFGLGVTGLNRPVMWALYIVNFVYFIGIGHAGTFISAALRVLKIEWRRPISRAAEIVTVFGLTAAAMFPIVHLGRSWKFYWLLPYPNVRQLWPSYHSPLMWDLTAILTYLTCSILFAYIALLPDLAMARDHLTGWRHRFYALLSLGWRGTEREWSSQEMALNVFSYGIIPVMFSVHTIVSWDFAMALQPGWHSTIFGPYFVVGALFSGTGAVLIALVLLRKTLHLEHFLRDEHFNGMCLLLLVLSLTWDYFYFNDYIVPWYGQDPVEKVISATLTHGWAAPLWYLMLFCNVLLPPALLWSKRLRTSPVAIMVVAVAVNIGMYLERVIIVPVSLGYNELPASWGIYIPHIPETVITICAFCLVGFLYLLFTRFFPMIPLWEVREGQMMTGLRRIGKALMRTRIESE
jgi:molybdopterin-containing oxidoreductase family membrane subunit